MDELLLEFKDETKSLIVELERIIESLDEDPSDASLYEKFGQIIDRIMGGAKSLALALPQSASTLNTIGDYAEVCKVLGYKMSQVNNPTLGVILTAFFSDTIENLLELNESLVSQSNHVLQKKNDHLLERLKWLAQQFDPSLKASIASDSNKSTKSQLQNIIFQFNKTKPEAKN